MIAQVKQTCRVVARLLHYDRIIASHLPSLRKSDRIVTTGLSTVSLSTDPLTWVKPMLTSGSISPNTLNIDVTYAATDVTSGATTCDAFSTYLRLTHRPRAYW